MNSVNLRHFRTKLFIFCILACAFSSSAELRKLTILHTNDVHARVVPDDSGAGGFANIAAALRLQRQNCSHCIHLSAGDLVQGMPVSAIFRGTPVFEIANYLGIDAFTLGNHEFDYGWQQIERFRRAAKFPILSANELGKDGRTLADAPYAILNVNGLRVGVIGLVMGNLVDGYLTPKTAGSVTTPPVVETARAVARQLAGQTDVILVLGHILPSDGSAIVRDVPEIAAVIQGHSHRGIDEMEQVDGRVVVNLRGYGIEIGRLDLDIDTATHHAASAKWTRIPVQSDKLPPDPTVARLVAKWERKVAAVVDCPIAQARRELLQTEVRLLMEQAMREEMGADFSYMNRGGVRDKLPKGTIREGELWNIMPFDNQMMLARMKGSQLNETLRAGRPVDPAREYTVTLSDYSVENPAQRNELGIEGVHFERNAITLRQVLINLGQKAKGD